MWKRLAENKPLISDSLVQKAELITAILLTLIIIFLNYTFMQHGGALWRDEANSANIATMPSFSEIWYRLQFDPFPLFTFLLLRFWTNMGLSSDLAMRFFGFLVSISVLAALWFNVRMLGIRTPLLSLLLFAFSPLSVRYISSIRPHGVGILLALLTLALTGKIMKEFRMRYVIQTVFAAVLCVHSLYRNIFFLTSFVFAAMVITALKHKWKKVFLLLLILILAAFSLLPYWPIIKAQDYVIIIKVPVSLPQLWEKLYSALAATADPLFFVWTAFFLLSIGLTIYSCIFKAEQNVSQEKRDTRLFCTIVMITSIILFFIFLKLVSVTTQPWYYLPIMAIFAICFDAIVGTEKAGTVLRIIAAVAVVASTFSSVLDKCRTRQTNIDIAAYMLEKSAQKGDLLVADPWYLSISFQRYYSGQASLITVPPLEDHRTHRYDLIKAKMASTLPLQPLFTEILKTLKAGNKVWMIKETSDLSMVPDTPAFSLAPAPKSIFKWSGNAYMGNWDSQILNFIQSLPVKISYFQLLTDKPVSQNEDCSVVEIAGSQ